jgi:hypothetical protein
LRLFLNKYSNIKTCSDLKLMIKNNNNNLNNKLKFITSTYKKERTIKPRSLTDSFINM